MSGVESTGANREDVELNHMSFFYRPWSSPVLAVLCYGLSGLAAHSILGPPEKFTFQIWFHPVFILLAAIPFVLLRGRNSSQGHSPGINVSGQCLLLAGALPAYYYLFSCLDKDPLSILGFGLFPGYLTILALVILILSQVVHGVQGRRKKKTA